jgi:signal peptidase I
LSEDQEIRETMPAAETDASTAARVVRQTLPSVEGVAPLEVPSRSSKHPAERRHIAYPSVLDSARSLLSIIVVALFVLTFVLQPFRIPSDSMEETLLVGDFLLVNKTVYAHPGPWRGLMGYRDVQRGDVIVFHFPPEPELHVVKRVIGVPGDRIHLKDGVVYRNGEALKEPYAVYASSFPDDFRDQFPTLVYSDPGVDPRWWLEMHRNAQNGEVVVPAGQYFVLGDNRNHSRDSRYWGFVPRENIVARPVVIYFSLRSKSAADVADLPNDRLGHDNDPVNGIVDFARWDRMFRVVR